MDKIDNLNEDELNKVVGGSFPNGKHLISDLREYEVVGVSVVERPWEIMPEAPCTFTYKGEEISEETAAAIVFLFQVRLNTGMFKGRENDFSKLDAIIYKCEHIQQYKEFIKDLR